MTGVLSEDDVACELTTGTVLCGSVSRALKSRKSNNRKTAAHQAAAADSQVPHVGLVLPTTA